MQVSKYVCAAAAMVLAGVVGVTSAAARPLPPGDVDFASAGASVAIAAPAPAPAVPTFVNGLSQNVFSANRVTGSLGRCGWSRRSTATATGGSTASTPTTRCHARRRPTDSRCRWSSRRARTTPERGTPATGRLTTRSGSRPRRAHRRSGSPERTRARISATRTRALAPTGLRRRACRDGRHRAFRRVPDVRCPERDAQHDRCDRLAQRPHQGLYDAHRHHRGRARELAQRQDRR